MHRGDLNNASDRNLQNGERFCINYANMLIKINETVSIMMIWAHTYCIILI